MSDEPSLMSHVSIGTNQFERAVAFWVQTPIDGEPASVGDGAHCGFLAASKAQVDAFHAAAVAAGAADEGRPGPRPIYGEPTMAVSCATPMATRSRRRSGTRSSPPSSG